MNLEVTHRILELTGADPSLVRHVEDRAGHDRRYALDDAKLGGSAGGRSTRSARPACPRPSRGTASTGPGGSRSSRANTAGTTRSSTRIGSGRNARSPGKTSCADSPSPSAALASVAAGAGRVGGAALADRVRPRGWRWGHGVGMSQWGAFGQAKAGRDYRAILAHYYPGRPSGPRPSPSRRSSACSSPTGSGRHSRPQARSRSSTRRDEGAGRPAVEARPQARAPCCGGRGDADPHAAGRSGHPACGGWRPPRGRREGVQGLPPCPPGGEEAPARERRPAGVVPPRRRARRDAQGLAAGRARGTGRRGAHLRDREPRRGPQLRPVLRRQEPALLRRERRVARHDARGHRDSRPGAQLRREAGRDVLLLLQRREDDERARRVRPGSPVPRLRRRPVGRGVAEPPLGDPPARRPAARTPPRPAGLGDGRLVRAGSARSACGAPHHHLAGGDERAAAFGHPQPARPQVARVHARRAEDRSPGRREDAPGGRRPSHRPRTRRRRRRACSADPTQAAGSRSRASHRRPTERLRSGCASRRRRRSA